MLKACGAEEQQCSQNGRIRLEQILRAAVEVHHGGRKQVAQSALLIGKLSGCVWKSYWEEKETRGQKVNEAVIRPHELMAG